MFTRKKLVSYYAISPVHLGAGQALGVIDNPIQRERHTGHPYFAGSGIKGALRHEANRRFENAELVNRVFGPERDASEYAGAVSFSDAQMVAFPVRSLKGVYAYVTCPLALERLARLAAVAEAGFPVTQTWNLDENTAVVMSKNLLVPGVEGDQQLVLESYAFRPAANNQALEPVSRWLAEHALPPGEGHDFFRSKLETDLVLISDTWFTYFCRNATVVEPHVRINDETGTADDRGLFFTENLPPESILAGIVMTSIERSTQIPKGQTRMTAEAIVQKVESVFSGQCVQIGGDATTGRGQVLVSFTGGATGGEQ